MKEIAESALYYVDKIVDEQQQFPEAKGLIYWKDLETPLAPKYTVKTLLNSIKTIAEVAGFRDENDTVEKLIENLRIKTTWFLDNLSIFKISWDKLLDSQCIFLAYMAFLSDFGLKVSIKKLMYRYQLFHEFPGDGVDREDPESKTFLQCKKEIYEICLWLNYGMIHLPEYKGEVALQRWTDCR